MTQRLFLTNDDGTETIDLLTGPLHVMNWGWDTQPTNLQQRITQLPFGIQASSTGYPQVVETFSLDTAGCADDIRDTVRTMEEFLENAKGYMDDPINADPHWLEWCSDGEDRKRALVCGGSWQWYSRPPGAWQMVDKERLFLKLALTRAPMWEDVDDTTTATPAYAVSSVGGTQAFAAVTGRVAARIAMAAFSSELNLSETLTTIWAGFRPEYHGLTAFNPLWECETDAGAADGNGALGADTADAVDALASGGYVAQVTFTDTALARRTSMYVETVIGSPTTPDGTDAKHFAGRYLVLCRCAVDGIYVDEGAGVQMRSGYRDGVMKAHDMILVSHTDPLYVELGEIQIPGPGNWDGAYPLGGEATLDDQCRKFTIELWAQNVDATTLDLDCCVLIPSDYFLHVEGAGVYSRVISPKEEYAAVVRNPDERLFGYMADMTNSDHVIGSLYVSDNSWYLPTGSSTLVLAAQRDAIQVVADDLYAILSYYPRWMSYRE